MACVRAFYNRLMHANKQHLRWAASAVVLALVALIVLRSWQPKQTDAAALLITGDDAPATAASPSVSATPHVSPSASPPSASPPVLVVDVIGAVRAPGVYALPLGARVVAAVEAAGGLAPTADRERINLAAPVQDGAQVRVPDVGDDADAASAALSSGESASVININTADAGALEALPGVGPATAAAIVQYRDEHGPFMSLDDLENVPRLGSATIDKFRDQITVGP